MSNKINSKFKKTISLIISSSVVVFSVIPNTLAKDINTNNIIKNTKENNVKEITNTDNIKENINKPTTSLVNINNFKKNHPSLYKFGKYGLWSMGIYTVCKCTKLAYREWYLKDVVTKIDNYSKEKINQHLNKEIEKYKDRERNIFKIDEKLIKKADKRVLLLILMKLNYLFDKYSRFTKDLIKYKNKKTGRDKEFLLRLGSFRDDGIISFLFEARTEADLGGFAFANLSNFKEDLYQYKKDLKSGFSSPHNMDELIDYIITHEFGHAIESLYIINTQNLDIPKIRGMGIIDFYKIAEKEKNHWIYKLKDAADSIKEEICKNANSDRISIYGSTASTELQQ